MSDIQLYNGDCLEKMRDIPDGSVDMVLCDLPYGTTSCKWDTVLPFEPLWEQYKRVCKKNAAICLFGSEPFSSRLRMSNLKMFKYDWIWDKEKGCNFLTAKKEPLRVYEIISVFYSLPPTYNPVLRKLADETISRYNRGRMSDFKKGTNTVYGNYDNLKRLDYSGKKYGYPYNIIHFKKENNNQFRKKNFHPTQKPVPLLEYLIKTYTNEGDTVLDNTMGSGSTGVACVNTGRNFIGIELDEGYFGIAEKRIREA